MNYNHFTINYISAVKKHLKIEVVNGKPLFFPDYILIKDLENLKSELQEIWKYSESSILILKNRENAKIQLGLFGLVDDFDLALKTGYLLGDRVVVLDYMFERIFSRKPIDEINLNMLGSLGINLVSAFELAQKGRFVIIPSPFSWNENSKKIIAEIAEKTTMTLELMNLLNMLSITNICKLHPYTIAESNENYNQIISTQLSHTSAMDKTVENYAYEGILGGLLTEKLINEAEFQAILNIPLNEYVSIIDLQENFYNEYLKMITFGGDLNFENNVSELKTKVFNLITERNGNISKSLLEKASAIAGFGSAGISLLTAVTVVSAPIIIAGGILGLSGTLSSLFKNKDVENNPVINVFSNLVDN